MERDLKISALCTFTEQNMYVLPFMVNFKKASSDLFMIERGLKVCTCRTALRMEGGVFFKELRMEGRRGSGGSASHTCTFPRMSTVQVDSKRITQI